MNWSFRAIAVLAWLPLGSIETAGGPPVTAVAFDPTGQFVLSGSTAGLVVRRTEALSEAVELPTSLEHLLDLQFSPDGTALLAVGGIPGESGTVELFDWPARTPRGRREVSTDVLSVACWRSPGHRWVAAGNEGVVLVESPDSEPMRLTDHSRGVTGLCRVLAGGVDQTDLIVSGSLDQTLRVWNPRSGRSLHTLHNHTAGLHGLFARPDGRPGPPVVTSIAADRTVRFWQPTIGRMMRFVKLKAIPLCGGWTIDGSLFVAGCSDGTLQIIDPQTAAQVGSVVVSESRVTSLAVGPREPVVAVGTQDGQVQVRSLDDAT